MSTGEKRERPKRVPGRTVYIGFRVYDPATKEMKNCRGLTVTLYQFTPEEAHKLVVDAVLAGVPTARKVKG